MASASMDRLLNAPRFASVAYARLAARGEAERLEGRFGTSRGAASAAPKPGLSRLLQQRAALLRHPRSGSAAGEGLRFDFRQRAVVKVHYFNHAGGGGAALKAHARYVARDAAGRDEPEPMEHEQERADEVARGSAHADYLSCGGAERSPFYDACAEGVDGAARAADWAARDKRHFRLILSAERGELIRDLPAFTREVMARAEAHLATRLDWVAVDHHDTDNPRTSFCADAAPTGRT